MADLILLPAKRVGGDSQRGLPVCGADERRSTRYSVLSTQSEYGTASTAVVVLTVRGTSRAEENGPAPAANTPARPYTHTHTCRKTEPKFPSKSKHVGAFTIKVECPTLWSTQRQIRPFLHMY